MRRQLDNLIANKNLNDPEVLRSSKMLDAVLNEYKSY